MSLAGTVNPPGGNLNTCGRNLRRGPGQSRSNRCLNRPIGQPPSLWTTAASVIRNPRDSLLVRDDGRQVVYARGDEIAEVATPFPMRVVPAELI